MSDSVPPFSSATEQTGFLPYIEQHRRDLIKRSASEQRFLINASTDIPQLQRILSLCITQFATAVSIVFSTEPHLMDRVTTACNSRPFPVTRLSIERAIDLCPWYFLLVSALPFCRSCIYQGRGVVRHLPTRESNGG